MSVALTAPSVAGAIAGALHVMGPPLDDPPLDDPPLDDPPLDDPPLDDPPLDDPPLDDPPLDDDDAASPELEAPLDDSVGAVSEVPELGVLLSELHALREHTTAVAANAAVKKRMNRLLTSMGVRGMSTRTKVHRLGAGGLERAGFTAY